MSRRGASTEFKALNYRLDRTEFEWRNNRYDLIELGRLNSRSRAASMTRPQTL